MRDTTLSNLHLRWGDSQPPLRPHSDVVMAQRDLIKGNERRVLLLGATPELAELGNTTVAVDKSERMIEVAWQGTSPTRRIICANWLDMPLRQREFTAVVGDGSLAWLRLADYTVLFQRLAGILVPGAVCAVRCYVTPGGCETWDHLRDTVMNGRGGGFHAFKLRLAMAIVTATRNANLPVRQIHKVFERTFPDRAALSAASGWSLDQIAEIDAYACQGTIYSFPKRREILATLPPSYSNARFVASGNYELAERCPLFVVDFDG